MMQSVMLFKKVLLLLFCVFFSILVVAQPIKNTYTIEWRSPITNQNKELSPEKLLNFKGAQYSSTDPLPTYHISNPWKNIAFADFSYTIKNEKFILIDPSEKQYLINTTIASALNILSNTAWYKKMPVAELSITPIKKNSSGEYEKLISFDVEFSPKINTNKEAGQKRKKSAQNSVLSNGTWYKIGLVKDGIYKLDKSFFQQAGIDVNAINPQSINIYGNGQGLVPFANNQFRHDDLKINRTEFTGEQDGVFNDEDFILFYANGPHKWNYNTTSQRFDHIKHLYTDTSYYFIGINTDAPYRIETQNTIVETENTISSSFDDYAFIDNDLTNLIKSGRVWLGEEFDFETTYEFGGDIFNFPNIDLSTQGFLKASLYARTPVSNSTSSFVLYYNDSQNASVSIAGVSGSGYVYAASNTAQLSFTPSTTSSVKLQFNRYNASSVGWLDYLEINVRRNLIAAGNQMIFRDSKCVGANNLTKFKLTNFSNYKILDITNPTEPEFMPLFDDGDGTKFIKARTDSLQTFIAYTESEFYTPSFFGSIENQNLHALGVSEKVDMVIVTHPLFLDQANELADFHRNYAPDPLKVSVVTPQQVYNEFSSGMQDITAIKDLMRMLYNRAVSDDMMPRYLLLFGDGSYNNRDGIFNNTNFIPTYQNNNSVSETSTLVSDDYYGLLDDTESDSNSEKLDIGIGRFTVKTIQEAKDVVKKTINYMTPKPLLESTESSLVKSTNLGNWRNILTFIGDDADNGNGDDGATHSKQADTLAETILADYPDYNVEKIILDSYLQVATPGGQRYPEVDDAIKRRIENGTLLLTYIGHGGETGWASEKILDVNTIKELKNPNTLPIFLTATCEFSRFDDPGRTSAGEFVLLNGNGGGVALCTTTRLAFVTANENITNAFFSYFFDGELNNKINLGDILTSTKNDNNARNFALLGDPALKIAYPKFKIITESITDTLGVPMDTIKALNVVKIKGYAADNNNAKLTNFNGIVQVTVFDKKQTIAALNNDDSNRDEYEEGGFFTFEAFKNVLYKGSAKVVNGDFSIVFVVPKDINLNVDTTGRISYYAMSGTDDANGFVNNVKIGDLNTNAPIDVQGPQVELFMNDENFVFGGFTNENPLLYAKVFDENGINTSGSGIGHDLISIVNEDNAKAIVLNDFYQSEVDSYKKGIVKYPFNKLEQGRYSLRLKVWDTHNNSGEAKTEFIVASSEEFALERLLNYPNPFTTKTDFYFEHNQGFAYLNVKIDVFTISGKLVKQINTVSNTDGFRSDPISWDGKDDYGDKLARGVYIYKLSLRNTAGKSVEKFEKLVILN
jgi:Peptidase family C25